MIGHVERIERVDWLIYHPDIEILGCAHLPCPCCGYKNYWEPGAEALKKLLERRRDVLKILRSLALILILFMVSCSPGPSSAVTIPPTSTVMVPTAQPTIISTTVHGVSVETAVEDIQTYLYHTELSGKRVYKPSLIIKKGSLIKVSTCINHYAQVEFQDGDWWKVRWIVCE